MVKQVGIVVTIVILVLVAGGSSPLFCQGVTHDCDDYCDTSQCRQAWDLIHNSTSNECANYMTESPYYKAPGHCEMQWHGPYRLWGETKLDCKPGSCTITGKIMCGPNGQLDSYSMSCTNSTGDIPIARADMDGASCSAGAPGHSLGTGVSCNQSTGELVWSNWE